MSARGGRGGGGVQCPGVWRGVGGGEVNGVVEVVEVDDAQRLLGVDIVVEEEEEEEEEGGEIELDKEEDIVVVVSRRTVEADAEKEATAGMTATIPPLRSNASRSE